MPKLFDILEEVEQLVDAKRPLAAIQMLEPIPAKVSDPATRGMVLYNLGCLYRSSVGNGVRGRSCFIEVCEQAARAPVLHDTIRTLWSNACENLMLLSLSYDEYVRWAAELRRLHPSADILRGQVPQIIALRDRGLPWSHAMATMAEGYYSRSDPQHDVGMYGDAASLFHLLLTHRKELRLGWEDWKRAVNEYGRLCLRLGADTALAAEKKNPMIVPREFVPIVADALPTVEEYLNANPKDAAIGEMRDSMQQWVRGLSEAEVPQPIFEQDDVFGASGESEFVSTRMGCAKCGQKIEMPVFKCPKCGHQLVRMPVVVMKAVLVGIAAFFAVRYAFASAPVWVPPLAGLVLGNFALMWATAKDIARQQLAGATTRTKSPTVQRQEKINEMLGIRRTSEVRCRNGHKMRSFEDEGVLLAVCPECGIVKPYPGTMARMADINRVAAKYDNFDF